MQHIHDTLPNAEKDVTLYFKFNNDNGYIELVTGEEQINGWYIYPHIVPTRVSY